MLNPFPPTHLALSEPNGLLASGGELDLDTLLRAYAQGIFPWFEEGQKPLWWTPDPRLVLLPGSAHASRSLKKRMRKSNWLIGYDTQFEEVIKKCAGTDRQSPKPGTWITKGMRYAYTELHKMGIAHSLEVTEDGNLVGGLYGVLIGKIFFGESMFSLRTNASKFAFLALDQLCVAGGIKLVDCQVHSAHLESLGAINLSRRSFENRLREAINEPMSVILSRPRCLLPKSVAPLDQRLLCQGARSVVELL